MVGHASNSRQWLIMDNDDVDDGDGGDDGDNDDGDDDDDENVDDDDGDDNEYEHDTFSRCHYEVRALPQELK